MDTTETVPEIVLLTDVCSKSNMRKSYIDTKDASSVVRIQSSTIKSWYSWQRIYSLIKDIFLPKGYPDSVSCDYLEYQIWDTCQAFCSSVSGTLTIRAIMQGIGVGSDVATPASAAATWIIKDGSAMLGSIVFAWIKGSKLDSDCKKWRLFADFLNDVAMFIELNIPLLVDYSIHLLCIATTFKALVGTAGSSTRAALVTHQAIKGNTADVSAKDGSQEIFMNLIALVIGIFLLRHVTETEKIWTVMCTATFFHLVFNYKAVKCLKMNVFNGERFRLCLRTYLPTSCLPTIQQVNRRESVFLFLGTSDTQLCGFYIAFGVSLEKAVASQGITPPQFSTLVQLFQDKNYFILPNPSTRTLYVTFRENFQDSDVLKAYFHSYLLAVALNILEENMQLKIISRSRKDSPVYRLKNLLQEYATSNSEDHESVAFLKACTCCADFIEKEYAAFKQACTEEGWDVQKHLVNIDDWRATWKFFVEVKKKQPAPTRPTTIQKPPEFQRRGTRRESTTVPQPDLGKLIIA